MLLRLASIASLLALRSDALIVAAPSGRIVFTRSVPSAGSRTCPRMTREQSRRYLSGKREDSTIVEVQNEGGSRKQQPEDGDDSSSFRIQTWNPLRLLVLRLGLTEPMATSPLNYGKYDGTFSCAYCGQPLFDSNSKYDTGSGWPSFWRTVADGRVQYKMEFDGRLECKCGRCSSHLGHVFLDGPKPSKVSQALLKSSPKSDPRGQNTERLPRFCINGAAMRFNERKAST